MTEPNGKPAVWQGGTVWLTGLPSAGKTTIALGLAGVDDPYEAPINSDLRIHTQNQTVEESIQQLRALLTARGLS